MTDLVACLSTGKGTWGHVARLIADQEWGKIFLVTNEFSKDKFKNEKNAELIVIDENKPLTLLVDDIKNALQDKITGTEVALNIVSGSGKEHMSILSALLKLGLAIRLVALTKDGIREL